MFKVLEKKTGEMAGTEFPTESAAREWCEENGIDYDYYGVYDMDKYKESKDSILAFFKDAMQVDGEVRFATPAENTAAEENTDRHWIRFEDSKRGVFYLTTCK